MSDEEKQKRSEQMMRQSRFNRPSFLNRRPTFRPSMPQMKRPGGCASGKCGMKKPIIETPTKENNESNG